MLDPLARQAGQAAGIHQGHRRLVYGVRTHLKILLCLKRQSNEIFDLRFFINRTHLGQ